jgi:hypothetical protein
LIAIPAHCKGKAQATAARVMPSHTGNDRQPIIDIIEVIIAGYEHDLSRAIPWSAASDAARYRDRSGSGAFPLVRAGCPPESMKSHHDPAPHPLCTRC